MLDDHIQQIVQERYGTRTTTSSLTQEEISALMCYPSITLTCCVSVPQSYGLAGRRFVTRRSILIPACADDVRQRGPYDAQDVPARPLLFTDRCSLPSAMGYLFPKGTKSLQTIGTASGTGTVTCLVARERRAGPVAITTRSATTLATTATNT